MATVKEKKVFQVGFEWLEGGGYIATSTTGKRFACIDLDRSIEEIASELTSEVKKRKKSKITVTIETV